MAKSTSKMVKRWDYYYKYICIWNNKTKTKKQVPIKLAHVSEYEIALYRKGIVETKAKQIKQDNKLHLIQDYEFEWNTDSGKAEIKKPITLAEGIDKFIENRNISKKTMCMNINSFNHWVNYLEPNIFCIDIKIKHLLGFVNAHKNNRSDTSINMDLRTLRTLLYFLRDMDEISIVPSFKRALKECPINDEEPIYITEVEFNSIINTDWCLLYTDKRAWYKEVFQLYWDTGARLQEPFNGIIKGNYLEIPKEKSKNGYARSIRITPSQADTISKMQRIWKEKNMSENHIDSYSKTFKKALRYCDIDESKHFHCLRHSYALRRRLETNGNYQVVQKELGHRSVMVTEKYQRCDDRKLKDDFPSYKAIIESLENGTINATSTRNTSTRRGQSVPRSLREMN